MSSVTINNFPPNGTKGEIRSLMFGPTGPMRVLIDIDSEDGEDFDIALTVSNAAQHAELKGFLGDLIELLKIVVEESDFEAALDEALEARRAEYVDEDEFFEEESN